MAGPSSCFASKTLNPHRIYRISSWAGPAFLTAQVLEYATAYYCGKTFRAMAIDSRNCHTVENISSLHNSSLPFGQRNEFFWTRLISESNKSEQGEHALRIYKEMRQQGVTPKSYTFVAALKACSIIGNLEIGKEIHRHVVENGYQTDIFIANSLVHMYCKCESIDDARGLFEKMTDRDLVSWNTMIMGYSLMEDGESALRLYARMQREGFVPNARTFVAALKASCSFLTQQGKRVCGEAVQTRCLEICRAIHADAVKSRFDSHIFVASTLVDVYAKCGSMADAQIVFDKMPYHNVVSWTAMIMCYAQKGEGQLALQLYKHMQHAGFTPNDRTYVAALMACGSLASLETGRELHIEICRAKSHDKLFIVNCLIDMYGKCGSMADAQRLFDAAPVRDAVTWSTLLQAYSNQGDCELVLDLFERMQREGMQPVGNTFTSVLSVCSHTGIVDKGLKYFQVMCLDNSISPVNKHYSCMVDLLGRAGLLENVMAAVEKMPLRPNVLTWLSILGACRKWNYIVVGRYAFDLAVSLDEKQAGAYILMTNLYASACMWKKESTNNAKNGNTWSNLEDFKTTLLKSQSLNSFSRC